MSVALKTIPKKAYKSDIYSWYPHLSQRYVRSIINAAIVETNKETPVRHQRSILVRTLIEKDIKYVIDTLGTPDGYRELDISEA